jgi:hypothetical protein
MSKKVWTPAMRAAFAKKMAKYRGKGRRRARRKNPSTLRDEVKKELSARYDEQAEKFPLMRRDIPKSLYIKRNLRAALSNKRQRAKNPTKAQIKSAASRIAKAAGRLAWAGTKRSARFGGRVAKAGAKAAAAEVKASFCRPRAKNPKNKGFEVRLGSRKKRKLVWTAQTRADAIHVAKVYAKAYPRKVVSVHAEK